MKHHSCNKGNVNFKPGVFTVCCVCNVYSVGGSFLSMPVGQVSETDGMNYVTINYCILLSVG